VVAGDTDSLFLEGAIVDRMAQKQSLRVCEQGSSQSEIAAKLQVDKSTIIILDQELSSLT
jgi:hypothetical protein